jgi:hypothetical protein
MIALTDVSFALKEWYHDQQVVFCVFKDKPFLDSLTRNPNAGGETDPIPILTSGGQGIGGGTYTTVKTNAVAPRGSKFQLTYGTKYTIVRFDEKTRRAASKSVHAFMDTTKVAVDSTLDHTGQQLSVEAIGNGGAPLGVISTINTTTNTIVLADPENIVNFWGGQAIVGSDDDGSVSTHTLRGSGAAVTVNTVNHSAGSFTYTGTDISGLVIGDYLFRQGNFAGNETSGEIMTGLQAWVPYNAPGSTTFYGVNRQGNSFLYGFSSSGVTGLENGNSVDRIRKLANAHNSRMGGMAREAWVHGRQWETISIILGQQGIRALDVKNSTGTWGYKGLEMTTSYGSVMIRADRHMPTNRVYLVDQDHIELRSIGDVMSTLFEDGLEVRKDPDAAGWQTDWVTYANIAINKPSAHAVGALPALV